MVLFDNGVTKKVGPLETRKVSSYTENCLLCSKGICGVCIKRCPVNTISKDGYDKIKCWKYSYGEESIKLA